MRRKGGKAATESGLGAEVLETAEEDDTGTFRALGFAVSDLPAFQGDVSLEPGEALKPPKAALLGFVTVANAALWRAWKI